METVSGILPDKQPFSKSGQFSSFYSQPKIFSKQYCMELLTKETSKQNHGEENCN